MKSILLTKGRIAFVDNENYEWLNQFKWHLDSKGYAIRWSPRNHYKRHYIYMHRVINKTPKGLETDHIDGNKLNNQKFNLRTVTHQENCRNNHKPTSNSGFLGVSWRNTTNKWRAYIHVNGKMKEVGTFSNIEDAIKARKIAEQTYWQSAYVI